MASKELTPGRSEGCLAGTSADPNNHDDKLENIPLLVAIRNHRYGDKESVVKLLLDNGANPNVTHRTTIGTHEDGETKWLHRTALQEAAMQGWTEGVKLLLEAGANLTACNALENPLVLALGNKDCSTYLIQLLLTHGADPNDHDGEFKNIPLLIAISRHRYVIPVVKLLLKHGASPNVIVHGQIGIGLIGESKLVDRSALCEALVRGETKVVKMLLDAGAKFTDVSQNPLAVALENPDCPIHLIDMLLNYTANPNYHKPDTDMPLVHAISNYKTNYTALTRIVQLLFVHGANPTAVVHKVNKARYGCAVSRQTTALHAAAARGWTDGVKLLLDAGAKWVSSDILECPLAVALTNNSDCPPDLISLLLKHGTDVNYTVAGIPLLHRLSCYTFHGEHMFLQQLLDLFFLNGGDINIKDKRQRTALKHTIRAGAPINSVRWLIRHGADAVLSLSLPAEVYHKHIQGWIPETHAVLMQAGLRVSHRTQIQLRKMEVALSTCLQDNYTLNKMIILRAVHGMWDELVEIKKRIKKMGPRKQYNIDKYLNQQMIDLEEFSDESLHTYPQSTHISPTNERQSYQNMLDQIRGILGFLSQLQSLQWICLLCIRDHLVSLHPSVVKMLPVPSKLKRNILCHEL